MKAQSVALITLTNKGYLKYTYNCIKSLERIGLGNKIKCYAIGKKAYSKLTRRGIDARLIEDEGNTEFQIFRQGHWKHVTFYKFEIIHQNLLKNDYVCFTDGAKGELAPVVEEEDCLYWDDEYEAGAAPPRGQERLHPHGTGD